MQIGLAGVFLSILIINLSWANETLGQKTLSVHDVEVKLPTGRKPIHEIFSLIEQKTDYYFAYDEEKLNHSKLIIVQGGTRPLGDILTEISNQAHINFRQINNQIAVSQVKLHGQIKEIEVVIKSIDDITVTGKITDENNVGLPGVSVLVQGTETGTISDADGTYTLTASDDAILVFSYIGYERIEVGINGRSIIDIAMTPDLNQLQEIVIVGYGSTKKVNLTGAVSTVNFDESINNRPITNASQALGGNVTGVWVSQNSGQPGRDGAQLRVRGWGTLNNSNPLVIIDGIEGVFSQLNPNDIEGITVLKDAASAAIYGSKAANGVILVTTKTGKKDQPVQVDLSSYVGFQSLGRRFEIVDNSTEYMELWNQGLGNDGSSPLYSDALISSFRNGNDRFLYPNSNFYDELFRTATIQEQNVSIRGGSSTVSSFISFNYLNQEGIVQNTGSTRYGIRANLESDLNSWLTIGGRLLIVRLISSYEFSRQHTERAYDENIFSLEVYPFFFCS